MNQTKMTDFRSNQLRLAADAINRIDDGKLNLLATRLAQHIVTGQSDKPFTEEELSKLEASLSMQADEVARVVQGIQELLAESAYHKVASNLLESRLATFQVEESKVATLVAVWAKAGPAICEALRQNSVLPQVSHIAYNLSVEAGSNVSAAEKNIRAHLQLGLKGDGASEALDLEFTHEGLFDLHSQLTRIQAQLDAIADK